MVTEAHHCCLFVLSRWREISLPEATVSSVQVDSEGWISWGRGPCGEVVSVRMLLSYEVEGGLGLSKARWLGGQYAYINHGVLPLHPNFEVHLLHIHHDILAP